MDQVWANRAASAEAAVTKRHLKRLWQLPGTQLGVVGWPPTRKDLTVRHLALLVAGAPAGQPRRRAAARPATRPREENQAPDSVTSLAQQRVLGQQLLRRHGVAGAGARAGGQARRRREAPRAEAALQPVRQRVGARGRRWHPVAQAGPVLQRPANGPAGIFLARYDDRLRRAQQMADWIDETLIDPETHLVFDGIKAGSMVRAQYTYCQGVVIGLETELAARTEDDDHAQRVHRLVAAVDKEMAPEGVIKGAGGGDGGLFNGILARYLALGRHHVAQQVTGRHSRQGHRPQYRDQVGAVGVGLPADRGRPAAVRPVLGPQCRSCPMAGGQAGPVRRGRRQPVRHAPSATCRCSCRAGC